MKIYIMLEIQALATLIGYLSQDNNSPTSQNHQLFQTTFLLYMIHTKLALYSQAIPNYFYTQAASHEVYSYLGEPPGYRRITYETKRK